MSPPVCSPRCEGNLAISAAANSSLLRVKNGSGGIGGATGGAGGKGSGGRGGALWAVSALGAAEARLRSEEHTSELQSLMRISYAVFCLKTKKKQPQKEINILI